MGKNRHIPACGSRPHSSDSGFLKSVASDVISSPKKGGDSRILDATAGTVTRKRISPVSPRPVLLLPYFTREVLGRFDLEGGVERDAISVYWLFCKVRGKRLTRRKTPLLLIQGGRSGEKNK